MPVAAVFARLVARDVHRRCIGEQQQVGHMFAALRRQAVLCEQVSAPTELCERRLDHEPFGVGFVEVRVGAKMAAIALRQAVNAASLNA